MYYTKRTLSQPILVVKLVKAFIRTLKKVGINPLN